MIKMTIANESIRTIIIPSCCGIAYAILFRLYERVKQRRALIVAPATETDRTKKPDKKVRQKSAVIKQKAADERIESITLTRGYSFSRLTRTTVP